MFKKNVIYFSFLFLCSADAKHLVQHLDEKKKEGVENEAVEQISFADKILVFIFFVRYVCLWVMFVCVCEHVCEHVSMCLCACLCVCTCVRVLCVNVLCVCLCVFVCVVCACVYMCLNVSFSSKSSSIVTMLIHTTDIIIVIIISFLS